MKNLTHIDTDSFYRGTGVAEPLNDGFCLAATTESLQPILPPGSNISKIVVAVANLAPRKMRFGVSESMILAACGEDGKVRLVFPDRGVHEGMTVR